MTQRDARSDWQAFAAEAIPTKPDFRPLEFALADVTTMFDEARLRSIIDAGCGVGVFSQFIYNKGFSVVGVDIHQEDIIQVLQSTARMRQASDGPSDRQLDFLCVDILSPDCQNIQSGAFDGVICQLVISIIGTAHDRAAPLMNHQ